MYFCKISSVPGRHSSGHHNLQHFFLSPFASHLCIGKAVPLHSPAEQGRHFPRLCMAGEGAIYCPVTISPLQQAEQLRVTQPGSCAGLQKVHPFTFSPSPCPDLQRRRGVTSRQVGWRQQISAAPPVLLLPSGLHTSPSLPRQPGIGDRPKWSPHLEDSSTAS